MHPLIAFLSFLFSPSDDWLLRQAFELYIDPSQVPAVVQSYEEMTQQYPSTTSGPDGAKISADAPALMLWGDLLASRGYVKEAGNLWARMEKDPTLPPEIADNVTLRLGEANMAAGDVASARQRFQAIVDNPASPRRLDASVDLLVCDLSDENGPSAVDRATEVEALMVAQTPSRRALFPLGLAAFAAEDYKTAADRFAALGDDPRAKYFGGLALRRLGRNHEALAMWQDLRTGAVDPYWYDLAAFQMAETYFSVGDTSLCRAVAERAIADNPDTPNRERLEFRLATLDMKAGDYNSALARLTPMLRSPELGTRASDLVAESMVKTGDAKDLFKALAQRKKEPSAQNSYELAWAAAFEGKDKDAWARAEQGLTSFYDADYTPRLLLLEGLSAEHLDQEAEAMATYQTIADRFPNSAAAAYATHWITRAYIRLGRTGEAVTHGAYLWNRLSPDVQRLQPETAYWIGQAHVAMKRYRDGETYLQQFLSMATPKNEYYGYGQFQLAVAMANDKQASEALAMLDQFQKTATDAKRNDWVQLAALQRGNILMNAKDFKSAVVAYRQAGDHPKARFEEAMALYRMDYLTDAIEKWTKLADAHPQDSYGEQARFRAARSEFELGHATAAVQGFAMFMQQYPKSPLVKPALLQSAHALYNSGDAAGAAPLYAKYLATYHETEDLATVAPYLASCYAKMNKPVAEAEVAMKGLPPTDDLASMRWSEGAQRYNDKKFDDAENLFASLVTDEPAYDQAPLALFYRAESLYQQEKFADASAAFGMYLKSDTAKTPDQTAAAMFNNGVALFRQSHLLDAAKAFEALLDAYPNDKMASDARENLLLCYHSLGDFPTEEAMSKKYQHIAGKPPVLVAQSTAAAGAYETASSTPGSASKDDPFVERVGSERTETAASPAAQSSNDDADDGNDNGSSPPRPSAAARNVTEVPKELQPTPDGPHQDEVVGSVPQNNAPGQ